MPGQQGLDLGLVLGRARHAPWRNSDHSSTSKDQRGVVGPVVRLQLAPAEQPPVLPEPFSHTSRWPAARITQKGLSTTLTTGHATPNAPVARPPWTVSRPVAQNRTALSTNSHHIGCRPQSSTTWPRLARPAPATSRRTRPSPGPATPRTRARPSRGRLAGQPRHGTRDHPQCRQPAERAEQRVGESLAPCSRCHPCRHLRPPFTGRRPVATPVIVRHWPTTTPRGPPESSVSARPATIRDPWTPYFVGGFPGHRTAPSGRA